MEFNQDILPKAPLAVALSGGVDSMALLLLLREHGYSVTALHVNHGLRMEAAAEAQQIKAWMDALDVPCNIFTVVGDLRAAGNIQQAARDARYALMTDWCTQHHIAHLCVAHHADDQTETFLMRLARGSGIDGLSAMQAVSQRGAVTLLRPLLHARKAALYDYVRGQGQDWLEDASNNATFYSRNRIRALLPLLEEEGITPLRIMAATSHMARAAGCLQELAEQWIATHCDYQPSTITFAYDAYKALHEELALRVMRLLLERYGNDKALRFAKLYPLVQLLQTKQRGNMQLHGCDIVLKDNMVTVLLK